LIEYITDINLIVFGKTEGEKLAQVDFPFGMDKVREILMGKSRVKQKEE